MIIRLMLETLGVGATKGSRRRTMHERIKNRSSHCFLSPSYCNICHYF